MKHLVLYHGNCMDGFASACVAAKYVTEIEKAKPEDVEFRAVQYGSPAPLDEAKGAKVYVLDFAFSLEEMLPLAVNAYAICWVDHHDDKLRHDVRDLMFELGTDPNQPAHVLGFWHPEYSGATATWLALFAPQAPPEVLRYVQDRDLWTWALPQSREVSAALDLDYRGAGVADWWQYFLGETIENLVMDGTILLRHQALRVAASVKSARQWHGPIGSTMDGLNVQIVNCPQDISEVGDALCAAGADVAVMYFQAKAGHWVYSLRSRPNEVFRDGFDCREVAAANGGGGHRNAAGFQLPTLLF